jgi:hypothetical protein
MSEHTYNRHSKSKFIITGPKETYSNIAKQASGSWNKKENGWVIPDSNVDLFKKMASVIHPDNTLFEPEAKSEPEPIIEEIVEPVAKPKQRRKFRRARSVGSSSSESDIEPNTFNEPLVQEEYKGELYDDDDVNLTSSSSDGSDSDSDSSKDFPHSSPNRKKLANDSVLDKMERTRRRMFELDMADKRKKSNK